MNNYELGRLENAISDLNNKKLQVSQHMASVSAPASVKRDATKAEILSTMRSTPPWDAILSELTLVVPDSIWLEIIESPDARHLRLKGYSRSQSEVAKLIARLERSDYFDNVELVFSMMGKKTATFELRAEITWT